MIYSSDRNFRIWNYTASHYSLLIRSPLAFPDEDGYSDLIGHNIDLEFWTVEYIALPTSIAGISLRLVNLADLPEDLKLTKWLDGTKFFELASMNRNYYIVAGGCLVGKNSWEREDRISNFFLNLKHDEILATF